MSRNSKFVISRREALRGMSLTAAAVSGSAAGWLAVQPCSAGPVADSVPGTSWPSFRRTPDQCGVAGGTLSANPVLKWEFPTTDGWVAAAAIVGDFVYAPSLTGYLYCLRRDNGQEVWKYRSIENPDPKQFAPGFKATPLVTADMIYVGDEDGVLHAIERESGKKRWQFVTDAEIAGCVAVFEDKLLLASHDSFLYCLNPDGTLVWKFGTNDRINCSPAIVDHFTFVAGCDEHLRVIDVRTGMETLDMPLSSFLIASPAIVGDNLYVGTHTGLIVCVDWRKGSFVWKYESPRKMPFHASAAVTDDLVVLGGHDKTVHALHRGSGEVRWTFSTRAKIESSGAVVDRRIFLGSEDGNLYGLSLDSGQEVWKFNAGRDITAGVAIGEGCLIAGEGEHNGRLLCFA